MAVEDYFAWTYGEKSNAWFHGSGKVRIDKVLGTYIVSYQRVGPEGYFWDAVWKCESLIQAKKMGTSGFPTPTAVSEVDLYDENAYAV